MTQTTHWPLGSRVPDHVEEFGQTRTGLSKVVPASPSFGYAAGSLTFDRLSDALQTKTAADRARSSGPISWLESTVRTK